MGIWCQTRDLLKLNDEELSSLAFNEPSCVKTDWRFADLQQPEFDTSFL
jgi:hypothetical protein